ncbi:hypothetical protein R75465_07591 [Paraburkholderia aspalathi]|nr:hypothetical protein R75465_07591 [Paraburkholderia aspalathi]
MHLFFTTERSPGSTTLGVFVVIEDAIQTIRERIRQIALRPEIASEVIEARALLWLKQMGDILAEIGKLIGIGICEQSTPPNSFRKYGANAGFSKPITIYAMQRVHPRLTQRSTSARNDVHVD